jgi:hypothetical protein
MKFVEGPLHAHPRRIFREARPRSYIRERTPLEKAQRHRVAVGLVQF